MINYVKGLFRNLFNPAVSLFSLVDNLSNISRLAKINRKCKILNSEVDIYTYVGPRTLILNSKIGKYCSISWDCTIGLTNHSINFISTSPIFTKKINGTGHSWINEDVRFKDLKKTIIGDDVWIGTHVIIMGGLKIGSGSIIGTGAIVTKDVPPYSIVVGVPAKVIGYRFDNNVIERLLNIQWWNMTEEKLKENIKLFQTGDVSIKLLDELN